MQLFVISDLHLGGRPHLLDPTSPPGSQICHAYPELTQFIDWVRDQAPHENSVELIINGDIVDFLMEEGHETEDLQPWMPDQQEALKKFKLIVERTRDGGHYGPFDAMARLLSAGQSLTFILGNHDIELSLPAVRKYLEEELLQVGTRGRFRFIYDGEAYTRGDVLIEHGNRYDPWNIVDHSALRQERSMLSRGLGEQMRTRDTGQFVPPPGSMLVSKVMNQVKRRYRFVDLLKPETHAVVPILLAMNPKLEHILKLLLQISQKAQNKLNGPVQPRWDGQLSTDNKNKTFDLTESLKIALGEGHDDLFEVEKDSSPPPPLKNAWKNVRELSENIGSYISTTGLFFDGMVNSSKYKKLFAIFRSWRGKYAIRTDHETPEYLNAVRGVADTGTYRCVVFGHTHLPKQIMLDVSGNAVTYINTGTWADVMVIPPGVLADDAISNGHFERFIRDLEENRITPYIKRHLTYAHISLSDNHVVNAKLETFCADNAVS